MQPVCNQVLPAGAEVVVERRGETSDVWGDVGKDLWTWLVVVAYLDTNSQKVRSINKKWIFKSVINGLSMDGMVGFTSDVLFLVSCMVNPAQRTSPLLQPSAGGWEVRDTERRAITYGSLVITKTADCNPARWPSATTGSAQQIFFRTDPLPHGLLLDASKMKSWWIPSPGLAKDRKPCALWCTDGVTTWYRKSSSSTRWISSHFLN